MNKLPLLSLLLGVLGGLIILTTSGFLCIFSIVGLSMSGGTSLESNYMWLGGLTGIIIGIAIFLISFGTLKNPKMRGSDMIIVAVVLIILSIIFLLKTRIIIDSIAYIAAALLLYIGGRSAGGGMPFVK